MTDEHSPFVPSAFDWILVKMGPDPILDPNFSFRVPTRGHHIYGPRPLYGKKEIVQIMQAKAACLGSAVHLESRRNDPET